MKPYVTKARGHDGHVTVENVPVADESEVEVIIVPKADPSQMSFNHRGGRSRSEASRLS